MEFGIKKRKEMHFLHLLPHIQSLWQEPHAPQWAQFPPQEDFPCFLSFRSCTIIKATIPHRIRDTRIVPQFAANHANIAMTPFSD